MIKTTYQEAKSQTVANGRTEVIEYLRKNGLKIKRIETLAYYAGVYGCNGHLFIATLDNGQTRLFTNGMRESWMYSFQNSDFGLPADVVSK